MRHKRSINAAILVAIVGFITLVISNCAGCQSNAQPHAPSKSESVLATANSSNASATSLIDAAARSVKAVLGSTVIAEIKAYATDALGNLSDAQTKAAATAASLDAANAARAKEDQDATAALEKQKKLTQEATDAGNSALMKTLRGIIVLGVLAVSVGVFLYIYSRSIIGEALAVCGLVAGACGLVCCFLVTLEHELTPFVVYSLGASVIIACVITTIAYGYELWAHRTALDTTVARVGTAMQYQLGPTMSGDFKKAMAAIPSKTTDKLVSKAKVATESLTSQAVAALKSGVKA